MTITMPEYQKRILREAADLLALYCQEAERENAALKREADDWAVLAGECAGSEAELREAVAALTVLRDRQVLDLVNNPAQIKRFGRSL